MRRNLMIALLYTVVTTLLFGVVYPLLVTGGAQLLFKARANGELIESGGQLVGSALIGQPFTDASYFHSRPSAAGTGYDAANSSGSNYGPTNQKLVDRTRDSLRAEGQDQPGRDVPVDLVTASASGLDPDITPAAAAYQVARVAKARHTSEAALESLVSRHTQGRQFGLLGEPRVNVLELNLELDRMSPLARERH